jgi:hypothetical protein
VKQLVAAGSDVNAKDVAGLSVTDKARRNGQGRIAALLEKSGAKSAEPPKTEAGEAKEGEPSKEGEAKPDEANKDETVKEEGAK